MIKGRYLPSYLKKKQPRKSKTNTDYMKSLKILIIEDEIFIAENIKMDLIERDHDVIQIAISYDEAMQSYLLRKPDLVLLDIRLKGDKSGIDFANFLKAQSDAIPFIFLTSQYDKRVLGLALETHPYGYITKPYHKESLWTSIESAYNLFISKDKKVESSIISDGRQNHLVKFQEILYLQADHVYTIIYFINDKKIIVRKSLQEVLDICACNYLLYCHRSYVVNTKHIRSWSNDGIILENGVQIPISRSRKDEIMGKLKGS
jgi:two-component system, LytTR family, response regulator LytT